MYVCMYVYIYVCTLSLNAYPVKTPAPILVVDGSKDVVWRAVEPLRQDKLKF